MDVGAQVAARVIEVEGALNLRDLGGLPTADARRVRTGRILRGDYPAFADPGCTPTAAEHVRRLGLRTVVDLRRADEVSTENPPWADHGVTWVRWPLVATDGDSWHARYAGYLATRPETVVGAARAVMAADAHPVLFHCAAGKDRTGTLAAMLLDALGVPAEIVVADYAYSAHAVEQVLTRLRGRATYDAMLAGSTVIDQTPQSGTMAEFLDRLADRGGAAAWFREHGLAAAELDAFRTSMLDP